MDEERLEVAAAADPTAGRNDEPIPWWITFAMFVTRNRLLLAASPSEEMT